MAETDHTKDFLDSLADAEAEENEALEEEISDEDADMDSLRAERDDLKDKFMRALAEAENARKRSEKDRREAQQYICFRCTTIFSVRLMRSQRISAKRPKPLSKAWS